MNPFVFITAISLGWLIVRKGEDWELPLLFFCITGGVFFILSLLPSAEEEEYSDVELELMEIDKEIEFLQERRKLLNAENQ